MRKLGFRWRQAAGKRSCDHSRAANQGTQVAGRWAPESRRGIPECWPRRGGPAREADRRSCLPREGQRRKEEQESEEEEDEESDEEEDRRSKRKRSRSPPRREGGGDRRPLEPDGPPPPGTTPLGRRLSRADTDRTAGHTKRHHDRGHRGHRSTKGHNKPKRRGGRKHKRLARLAADPTKVLGPVPARPVKMARFVEGAEYGLLDKEAWSAIFPRPGMVLEVQMKGTDISVLEEEWAASS